MKRKIKTILCCMIICSLCMHSIGQTVIKLRKKGNVYILPCKVNGVQMSLFFDTGADDVSLSMNEATYMVKNGYLKEEDIVGKQSYTTANGDVAEGTKIIIRKITFAGLEINDVAASVMPNSDAPLLFGQSAIGKLGKIQIDPETSTLTIFKGKGNYDFSNDEDADKVAVEEHPYKDARPDVQDARPYNSGNKSVPTVKLSKTMTLTIDRPGGANGASIAWHPVHKKYYAAMAGNVGFPMVVFDANGSMVSPKDLFTMFDVRGLWYNPTTQTLQANGYNDFGLTEYILDAKGIPAATRKINIPASQPSMQSVGAYDPKNNMLYYYDMESVGLEPHRMKNGEVYKTIPIYLGAVTTGDVNRQDKDEAKYNYNENTIVYTGISHAEVGFLNVRDRQIELYDIGNGLMTKVLSLPEDAPIQSSLNFSYSNGIYWLFDKTTRVWQGYK